MFDNFCKLGLILVGIYLLIAISALIYSIVCKGMMCDIIKHLPILPWISIFNKPNNDILLVLMIIGFHLLNIVILYFIGMSISMGIGWIRR